MKHTEFETQPVDVTSLKEQALACLKKSQTMTVVQLYEELKTRNRSLTKGDVADLVLRLTNEGRINIEDIPPATRSLWAYLRLWERNLWLYATLASSLAMVLTIYVVPSVYPQIALRWILGSLFVLVVPGYAAVEALFPRAHQLDGFARLALSVALSLALVPLFGLLLNYTPWGVSLASTVVAVTTLTVGLSLVALARQFRLGVGMAEH